MNNHLKSNSSRSTLHQRTPENINNTRILRFPTCRTLKHPPTHHVSSHLSSPFCSFCSHATLLSASILQTIESAAPRSTPLLKGNQNFHHHNHRENREQIFNFLLPFCCPLSRALYLTLFVYWQGFVALEKRRKKNCARISLDALRAPNRPRSSASRNQTSLNNNRST